MSVEWLIIRGSGVVAFSLLSAATIWGLLLSTKLLGRSGQGETAHLVPRVSGDRRPHRHFGPRRRSVRP